MHADAQSRSLGACHPSPPPRPALARSQAWIRASNTHHCCTNISAAGRHLPSTQLISLSANETLGRRRRMMTTCAAAAFSGPPAQDYGVCGGTGSSCPLADRCAAVLHDEPPRPVHVPPSAAVHGLCKCFHMHAACMCFPACSRNSSLQCCWQMLMHACSTEAVHACHLYRALCVDGAYFACASPNATCTRLSVYYWQLPACQRCWGHRNAGLRWPLVCRSPRARLQRRPCGAHALPCSAMLRLPILCMHAHDSMGRVQTPV